MKSKLLSVFILLFSILFSCKTSNITPKQTEKKPINVLFIAVDDLKPMTGAYGVDFMQTPHLDNLAAEGFIFTNNHCQQAVCGPTRASLLTGKRPDYTQVYDLKNTNA